MNVYLQQGVNANLFACYSYVLLHHVMGEIEGVKHAWAFPEGGMGGVSQSIANAAQSYGATIMTEKVNSQSRKIFMTPKLLKLTMPEVFSYKT